MEAQRKIPVEIHGLLTDLAKIRQGILENAPHCLPIIAPAFIDAEQRINAIWHS